MPNIELINVSGQTVKVFQEGVLAAQLPAGFAGQLTLVGSCIASVGGSLVVTTSTNYTSGPSTTGDCFLTVYNNTGSAVIFHHGNYPVGSIPTAQFGNNWTQSADIGPIPNFSDANVYLTDNNMGSIAFQFQPSSAEQVTRITNIQGGILLGNFTADTRLKSVMLQPETLIAQGYDGEAGWVGAGFGLGLTAYLCLFIFRTLRGLTGQGGDF